MTRSAVWIFIALPGLLALALILYNPANLQLALVTTPIILLSSIGIARRYPIGALNGLVFVFMTANVRLGIVQMGVDNAGGIRGWIYVGDILFLGFVIAAVSRRRLTASRRRNALVAAPVLLMMPYVLLSIALPVLGVVARGLPASYALPGVRWTQWLILAYIAYVLAKQRGVAVAHSLSRTVMLVALPHAVYALLQLGYYQLRVVPSAFVAWDEHYVMQNFAGVASNSWFGWRVTGLQVNPNLYGLIAAFVMIAILSRVLTNSGTSLRLVYVSVVASALGILLSGSRTALVMLVVACVGGVPVLLKRRGSLRNWSLGLAVIVICAIVTGAVGALWDGTYLTSRFGDTLSSLDGLRMDKTVVARQEAWDNYHSASTITH